MKFGLRLEKKIVSIPKKYWNDVHKKYMYFNLGIMDVIKTEYSFPFSKYIVVFDFE